MTWSEYVASVDDTHQMTTAKEHLVELCCVVHGQEWRILELGSHAGLSTAALAIAAPASTVASVDLCDTVPESHRVAYWETVCIENIQPIQSDAGRFLRDCKLGLEPWDFIFHDAVHGEAALPEYLMAAEMCRILAIHDFEQLSEASQQQVAGRFRSCTTSDDQRGRRLFVGWK